ncbi:MAG: PEP/pyruvate-binding domain-containing protein [Syntrophobacteraceae bacterium]
MRYLVRFEDQAATDPNLVGRKFASLARASRGGFPVPAAVAIRTEAYSFYLERGELPSGLIEELASETMSLDIKTGLSVRSSGTSEDLENRSFAGQYKTFLDVGTEVELREKIKECWASAGRVSSEYIRSCAGKSGAESPLLMAVILQQMVHAAVSGVAFSRNPIYPERDEIVIECVRGVGENLVGGHVTPQRAFVDPEGVVRRDCEGIGTDENFLDREQWICIAELARELEELSSGKPQDIEWAISAEGKLWLLQSRPITTGCNPDHDVPRGIWTRNIANDLWSDKLTPFLGDVMMRNSARFDFSKEKTFLGIPGKSSSLAVIRGFLYINCKTLEGVLSVIPERFRTADLKNLFPPGFKLDETPFSNRTKTASILLRFIVLLLRTSKANPLLCCRSTRRKLEELARKSDEVRRLSSETPWEALKKVRASVDCMAFLQELNQWPYFYATVFTWLMRWLVVDRAGFTHHEFLHILSEETRNITIEVEQKLRDIANAIRRDTDLTGRFLSSSPEDLMDSLPLPVREQVDHFLELYGVRSRQRTIYVKRWAEAPEEVLGMLALLLRSDEEMRFPSAEALDKGLNGRLISRTQSKRDRIRCPSSMPISLVKPFVRGFLDLREELRFYLDKILFEIRQGLLTIGRQTGLGERSMFLKERELQDLIEGRMSGDDAHTLSGKRLKDFLKRETAASFYVDGRSVDELPLGGNCLRGIGVSPGRVTGRARIIENPTRSNLRKGDILVASNTDPGWTPILSMVGGVVAEEGGLLNHLSIVARELGIPTIVGLRGAVKTIPEGALITIDGSLGIVQVL